MNRTYLSGSTKRKLKKSQEIKAKKARGSILKFTSKVNKVAEETELNGELPTVRNYDSQEFQEEAVKSEKAVNLAEDLIIASAVIPENSVNQVPSGCQELFFSSDPANWNIITDAMIDYFLRKPPCQNMELIPETGKVIGGCNRFLKENSFYRIKKNNEKVLREWLVLSESVKKIFCWICKLFSNRSTTLSSCGYDDWKHISMRLKEHENSSLHRESILRFSQRLKSSSHRIDSGIIKQYQNEVQHWRSILQRIVETVKFLSSRGMAFFGKNETIGSLHNGNFLGCLELIAKFDPFLAQHLEKSANQGTGNVNYLSSTIVNEFIELMGVKVLNVIKKEVLQAKYFSIIVDSTPDITHIDQLCFILRYLDQDYNPVERFMKFIPIFGHGAEYLANVVISAVEEMGLDLQNCRGQSYDNASNMSGKYSGLQARIKALNPQAEYVPCSAHSLNLVGVNAAECCTPVIAFFSILQELYTFFSASTYRWQLLNQNLANAKQKITIKNLSCTRWCADANASKSLRKNYLPVVNTLHDISVDQEQTASTRNTANALHKKLLKFENAINTVVWDVILQRLNQTSKCLQNSAGKLETVSPLFESLINFIQSVRDNFEAYENEARVLLPDITYEMKRKKITPRSKCLDDGETSDVDLESRDEFIVKCHYVLCDSLISNLHNRKTPYENILKKFSCLLNIKSNSIKKEAKELLELYPSDLDEEFIEELEQFSSIIDEQLTADEMLQTLKKLNLTSAFANVETALRIFLTIPISNCAGERSFSLLKRLKSPLRSYLQQQKLSYLSVLCLNSDITGNIDYNDLIDDFAECKIRKKTFKRS